MAPYGAKIGSLCPVMTPAMSPPFLLLFSLLAVTHTYSVPVKSDSDPNEIYYMNGNIRCLRCSPGMYVFNKCTVQDTESVCAPCLPGYTYSEHLTGQNHCFQCSTCRADQEEISPCAVTKNTVCRCRKGTYCPPGDPCEMCQKCTTRCPPDQVIQTPCNSTADAQCASPETDSNMVVILVPVLLFIMILVAVVCVWFFCCRKKGSKWIRKMSPGCIHCEDPPAEDTETPFLPPQLHLSESLSQNEKNEAINKTFDAFVDLVPGVAFERFVRGLGLTDNEIYCAEKDNSGTQNQQHAMLSLLYLDSRFDVNIWLEKLREMNMRQVAQNITDRLIQKGLFERSPQG